MGAKFFSGDIVSLYDSGGLLVNQVIYGAEGGLDQSLVRVGARTNDFVFHSSAPGSSGRIFSPGEPTTLPATIATPEPSMLFPFMISIWIGLKRKQQEHS